MWYPRDAACFWPPARMTKGGAASPPPESLQAPPPADRPPPGLTALPAKSPLGHLPAVVVVAALRPAHPWTRVFLDSPACNAFRLLLGLQQSKFLFLHLSCCNLLRCQAHGPCSVYEMMTVIRKCACRQTSQLCTRCLFYLHHPAADLPTGHVGARGVFLSYHQHRIKSAWSQCIHCTVPRGWCSAHVRAAFCGCRFRVCEK